MVLAWTVGKLLGSAFLVGAPSSMGTDQTVLSQALSLASQEPIAEKSVPAMVTGPTLERPSGTYWTLQNNWPPLPFDPFPELPVYALDSTNRIFILDDRSVD